MVRGYAADQRRASGCSRSESVKYNEGAQLDPSQMGGGRGSGGKIAIGGGAGLIVLVLALLFGLNPGDILGGAQQAGPEESEANPSPFAQCTRGSDINTDRDCRFVAYTNSIQDYWNDNLQDYQTIKVVTFTGSINTACGNATSAVGPFYCPADTTVYLDLEFFDQLTGQLGAQGGDAAGRGACAGARVRPSRPEPGRHHAASAEQRTTVGTHVASGPARAASRLATPRVVQARDGGSGEPD